MNYPKVLIVEDKAIVAHNLEDRLKALGYEVPAVAFSGEEAIQLVADTRPDLVLMDIQLPGEMDGVEAAQKVREKYDIPVVYLTGHADDGTLRRAKITEPYGYILKPFEVRELHSTIEIALYKHATEKRLRESEKRYRTLSELVSDFAFAARVEPDGQLTYEWATEALTRLTGYSLDDLAAMGGLLGLLLPEDRPAARRHLETLLSGQIDRHEGRFLTKGGDVHWLCVHGRPIWDPENGRVTRIVGAAQDITDRKKAELALQHAHSELEKRVEERTAELRETNLLLQHEIAERQQAEGALQQRNRELTLLNHVIAASAGSHSMDSLLETTCHELAQALGAPSCGAVLFKEGTIEAAVRLGHLCQEPSRVLENALSGYLIEHRASLVVNNTQTDVRLTPVREMLRERSIASLLALPLFADEDIVGWLGLGAPEPHLFSIEDIDLAQRVAEQISMSVVRVLLAEAQQRLSSAVEQTADTIIITDAEGRIVYTNHAFEVTTGYSRAEATGQISDLFEDDRHDSGFSRALRDTMRTGQVWQGRFLHQRRDGSLYPVDATITPTRNQAAQIVNYVGTLRDATREVELEEQLRHVQKMDALGRLAGGIAHDFNNFLSIVRLGTQAFERQISPHDPLNAEVHQLREAADKASELVRQLLSFSRRDVTKPRRLDLNQVVADLGWMLQRLVGHQIEIVTALADQPWLVEADPSQLEQVLMNLVINARDAMPTGGTLTIETSNVVLDATRAAQHRDARPGKHVLLVVSDTGIGMTDDVRSRIFEPYFTTKSRGQGTGLGLTTVFGIIKESGGHIQVHSEVGRGTRFEVYLPALERSRE